MTPTDDATTTALLDATTALTERVQGRPDSMQMLLEQPASRRAVARPVRRLVPVLAAVAAAAVVAATLVVGLRAGGPTAKSPVVPAGGGSDTLSTGPYPTSDYFLAEPPRTRGAPDTVVVRASDGQVVRRLPTGSAALVTPVLAPDGATVYGVSATDSPAQLLAYDVASGRTSVLDSRAGILIGPSISADGSTLAYEWSAVLGDPEHSTSVIVRDLRTGTSRVLTGAPAGPQVLSMALSPDGSRLAVVPTLDQNRPLVVVSTRIAAAFGDETRLTTCAHTAEPRWTAHGLYVLDFCSSEIVSLMAVDPAGSRLLHHVGPSGVWAYTPLPGVTGDRFVVADETQQPAREQARLYDPVNGWAHTSYANIAGLAEVTSE